MAIGGLYKLISALYIALNTTGKGKVVFMADLSTIEFASLRFSENVPRGTFNALVLLSCVFHVEHLVETLE